MILLMTQPENLSNQEMLIYAALGVATAILLAVSCFLCAKWANRS